METDDVVGMHLQAACTRLTTLSNEELTVLPFMDLTVLCQSAGLCVANSQIQQMDIIQGWHLSCTPTEDSPAPPEGEDKAPDAGFSADLSPSPTYSVPGSPFQGFASLVSPHQGVLPQKQAASTDNPEGLFLLASDTTSMCEVRKWRRREAADTFFPDHVLTQKHNQNKYNFLHDTRQVVKKANLTNVLEVELALKDISH
jgi:hypothetical protein